MATIILQSNLGSVNRHGEVDCPLDRGAPVIVEEGVRVTDGWEAWRAAEARGWARRSYGGCEAWLAPNGR